MIPPGEPLAEHAAVLLANGKVLVVGSTQANVASLICELCTPTP